jgi:hypothetical protein
LTILANVYELQGRVELSKETARRSLIRIESTLKHRPDAAEVLGVGAATLVYLGENTRAVEWASRAVSLEPSNHTVRYNAACAYAVYVLILGVIAVALYGTYRAMGTYIGWLVNGVDSTLTVASHGVPAGQSTPMP